jgi:glycosyltransferase involved in cell wall biosynthesis
MNRHDGRSRNPEARNRSVLFLVNSLNVGGSERKTVRLANALAAGNRQVVIAYLSAPETLLAQVHSTVATVHLHRRGKFSVGALRRLVAIIEARSISTVVAMNLYSALYAVLARPLCKGRRPRVIVSVNTTDFATPKEELQMLIYRHVLRRADAVVFGAERQRRLWRSRYGLDRRPDRTLVLYNGVDIVEFSRANVIPAKLSQRPKSRVTLGTVGAFRIEKAQIDLVRAVHELGARGVDVGAVMVGDGPQRAQIEREIGRLGVERNVTLIGEAQDVRPYLAVMDIFVLPSIAVETFSNAVLEAMAMSCPVVASRIGGMEEMLQFGGGLLYPPGDVNTLCNLLLPLVVSLQARMELGEQARQAVEKHFSFDAMLSAFESRVLNSGEHTSVPDV